MKGDYPLNVLNEPDGEVMPRYFRKLMKLFASEFSKVETKEDWYKHRERLKSYLFLSLGEFPEERTPLEPEIVGEIRRDGYLIRKLIFQSRPNLFVTANLYLPTPLREPAPAVLSVHGHFSGGKTNPIVQTRNIALAKRGYVVLCLDSIGSGERAYQGITYHGKQLGAQVFPSGLTLQGLQVWDNMRAIDYLQSLDEVDPSRIGCTGASGGGNQTYYLAALDERVKAAVPVCGVGSFSGYLDGPCCVCEMIPGVMRYAEQADILALIAPRPLLIISAVYDTGTHFRFEDVRDRTFPKVKRIYELLEAGDKIELYPVESGHGYNKEMRQAMYAWFDRWLKGDREPDATEPEIIPEEPKTLLCLGDYELPVEAENVPSLSYKTSKSNLSKIGDPPSGSVWLRQRELIRDQIIHEVLRGFPRRSRLSVRLMDRVGFDKYVLEKMTYNSEGGVIIPVLLLIPKRRRKPRPLVVQIHPEGKEEAFRSGLPERFVENGHIVMLLDQRGVGETRWDKAEAVGVEDYQYFQNSTFLGRPYLGMCVWDVLRGIDYMINQLRIDPDRIACVGNGIGGLIALFCAALDERVTAAACWDILGSFLYPGKFSDALPMNLFLPNITHHADIPHVASLCAPRPLLLMNLLDGGANRMSDEEAEETFSWARRIYETLESQNNLKIWHGDEGWEDLLIRWVYRSLD
jgi:cephalosporin-C deacetylase-like acetyl esterase